MVTGQEVRCWGDNDSMQLGVYTTGTSSSPVSVAGFNTGVTAIAAGPVMNDTGHTCAVVFGAAKCWGLNYMGQLGGGPGSNAAPAPIDVFGLSTGVTAIATGASHSCAIVSNAAQCWGDNWSGELGKGVAGGSNVPVQVVGLTSSVTAIAAGVSHNCAVVAGAAKCWGWGTNGQLGNGLTSNANAPVEVTGLSTNVSAVGAGYAHTCAIVSGGVVCWGDNEYGQLGNNSTSDASTPQQVTGLTSGVTAIAVGRNTACAIVSSGVQCWGAGVLTPTAVPGALSSVQAISVGNGFQHGAQTYCAIVSAGAKCWGRNYSGQLGNGSTSDSVTPVNVTGLSSGVTAISTGGDHTCAVVSGAAKCWGYGSDGQLGNDAAWKTTPVLVSGITPADPLVIPPDIAAPVISSVNPVSGTHTTATTVNLTFAASDDSGGAVNCVPASGTVVNLNLGANNITITCSDPAGNTALASTLVTRDAVSVPGDSGPQSPPSGSPAHTPPAPPMLSLPSSGKVRVNGSKVKLTIAPELSIQGNGSLADACQGKLVASTKPKGVKKAIKGVGTLRLVDGNCVSSINFTLPKRFKGKSIPVVLSFTGNATSAPQKKKVKVKVGG